MTNYRSEIDGLRCIAVSIVILYHFGVGAFSGGFVGVDVFFVISGYLITRILHDEIESGTFSFENFYVRRARRILPALFCVLFFSVIIAWILLSPDQLAEFSTSLIAVAGFFSNHHFLGMTGYFSPSAEEIPLLHTWTLSVEEQFYIVIPIFMIAIYKLRPKAITLSLLLLLLASFFLCVRWEHRGSLTLGFFLAAARAWEFLAGAIVAIYIEKKWPRNTDLTLAGNVFSTIGLLLVLGSAIVFSEKTPFPGFYTVIPVVGTMLIIYFATSKTYVGKLFSTKAFVAVGLISYSAYLWHQPLLAFYRITFGQGPGDVSTLALILTIGIFSYGSWRFIEAPFRDKSIVSKKAIWIYSVVGTFLFITFGIFGSLSHGFPNRYSTEQNSLALSSAPSPMRGKCQVEGVIDMKPENACRYFGSRSTWAVLGDSHAVEISYALAEYLRDRNAGGVLQLAASGCQPALLFETLVDGCMTWTNRSIEYIANDKNIRDVVLSYRHSYYLFGVQSKTYPKLPNEHPNFLKNIDADQAREQYWESFSAMITRLVSQGKTVHVVEPIPELGRPVTWNIFGPTIAGITMDRSKGVDRSYYDARNAFILSKIRSMKMNPKIKIIQTEKAFCDAKECMALDNGKSLYFDDNHLSINGAKRVIRLLFEN